MHTKQTAACFTYNVVKRNKRLYIEQKETGELVYTPPDFIKLHSRKPLLELADSLLHGANHPSFIKAIVAFETKVRPV